MGNFVLVNSGFPQAKEFLQKLSEIWARALKNVRQPCSRAKNFKRCRFEGAPTCLGPALFRTKFQENPTGGLAMTISH
jgi:hypothetical protein